MTEPDRIKLEEILSSIVDSDMPNSGDYSENGILHCGVCHEPKREWVECDGNKFLIRRECKCARDKQEQERKKQEVAEQLERIKTLRGQSLMNAKFYRFTFENYVVRADNESQYNMCVKYCNHFRQMMNDSQGLLLYGPVGTGKSFSAACIANTLLNNCVSVIMTSLVLVLKQMSADFNAQESITSELMSPDLLILDDFGTERTTDFAVEKVYDIIDSRYRSGKPLILTTNLSIQEMKRCTDIRYERIYDRVFEMCYPIKFDGVSLRKIEAKDRFDKMKKFFEGD